MIEEKQYDSDGSIITWQEWKYNEDNRIIEKTIKDHNGLTTVRTIMNYDKSGRLKKETTYDGDGEILYYQEHVWEELL